MERTKEINWREYLLPPVSWFALNMSPPSSTGRSRDKSYQMPGMLKLFWKEYPSGPIRFNQKMWRFRWRRCKTPASHCRARFPNPDSRVITVETFEK